MNGRPRRDRAISSVHNHKHAPQTHSDPLPIDRHGKAVNGGTDTYLLELVHGEYEVGGGGGGR